MALAVIEASCKWLVEWWRSLKVQLADRDGLLSELLWVGDRGEEFARYQNLQLGHAFQVAGVLHSPWEFSVTRDPVKHSVLSATSIPIDLGETPLRIRDREGQCYRSLRRYLYNTYVRKHRECYQAAKGLSRKESLLLNGEMVCERCLAFIIWRMSIEGLSQVDGLRFHRKDNFTLRLMGPPQYHLFPHEVSLRWSYRAYFGIWKQLDSWKRSSVEQFKVVMSAEKYSGHVFWIDTVNSCTDSDDGGFFIDRSYDILYPVVPEYNETGHADWRKRCDQSKNMITADYAGSLVGYERLQRDVNDRAYLFQGTFPSRSRATYETVYLAV